MKITKKPKSGTVFSLKIEIIIKPKKFSFLPNLHALLKSWEHFIDLYLRPIARIAESELGTYDKAASTLLSCWKKCSLSKTFKIHWMTRHAPEFVRRNLFSIGYITEQGIEALHAIWTLYDKRYNSTLRVAAVLRWNRLHLDNSKRFKKFKKPGAYKKSPKSSPRRKSRSKN